MDAADTSAVNEQGAVLLLWHVADTPAAPTASSSGSTTVIILVAVVTVLGTVATAMGPTLVEIVKGRAAIRATTPTPPAAPSQESPVSDPLSSVVRSGSDALDMVEAAVLDYRQQRDAALLRVDTLQGRLDEANSVIARQQVIIAQLEARLTAQSPPTPGPYGQGNYGNLPPDWRPR